MEFIEDRSFQNWLREVGIMKTINTDSIAVTPLLLRERHLTNTEERIWQILYENKGFLISMLDFTPSEYKRLKREAAIQYTHIWMSRLKAKLASPELVFNRAGIGYGLGIIDYTPTYRESELLYLMYQNLGKLVSRSYLSETLFSGGFCSNDVVPTYISRLNKKSLSGLVITIVVNRVMHGYTLVEKQIA